MCVFVCVCVCVCVCLICRRRGRRGPTWCSCSACPSPQGRCSVSACWTLSSTRYLTLVTNKNPVPQRGKTSDMICFCLLCSPTSHLWRTTWFPSPGCCWVWTPCLVPVSSALWVAELNTNICLFGLWRASQADYCVVYFPDENHRGRPVDPHLRQALPETVLL